MKRNWKRILPLAVIVSVLCLAACRGQGAGSDSGDTGTTAPAPDSTADQTRTEQPQDTGTTAKPEQPGTPEQPEDPVVPDKSHAAEVDLILFMGQSNMAGRGSYAESTTVGEGHAYEFKAISDPTRLYPLRADFGVAENTAGGANDGSKKTGSLVPAFCEAYWQAGGVPVVAVSCSQGGTRIDQWQTGGGKLEDAVARLNAAKSYLDASTEFKIRSIYMVWCQGESDARSHTSAERYTELTKKMFAVMRDAGVRQCFLIGIGNYNGTEDPKDSFVYIQQAQRELCAADPDFLLVSTSFAELRDRMKDDFHFYQDAYNLVGAEAGRAAGAWARAQNGRGGLLLADYDTEHREFVTWNRQ